MENESYSKTKTVALGMYENGEPSMINLKKPHRVFCRIELPGLIVPVLAFAAIAVNFGNHAIAEEPVVLKTCVFHVDLRSTKGEIVSVQCTVMKDVKFPLSREMRAVLHETHEKCRKDYITSKGLNASSGYTCNAQQEENDK